MHETPSSELLARYLAGETTPAEREEIERWAAASPEHAVELDRLRRLTARRPAGSWDVERAWARVSSRLDQPVILHPPRRFAPGVLAWAAILVLALGAALVWRATRLDTSDTTTVVVTAPGQRRVLDLSDGTRVTLAPDTELRVAPGYGREVRRVDLAGEAWFEVTHDAARPFLVYAEGTITEDLGTEFAVRALPGAGLVRVAVVSGSASLRREGASPDERVTLHAADMAELRVTELVPTVRRGVPLDAYVSWREGRLSFEDTPLDSVAADLARWYAATFRVTSAETGARRFTGPLPLDRLEEALEILGAALTIRVERRADTVLFRGIE